jgi:hypothetical protein
MAAFDRRIIHDGGSRSDRMHHHRVGPPLRAMPGGVIDVHRTEQVIGAHDPLLMVPDHVAEFEKTKSAVAHDDGHGFVVLDRA